MTPAELKHLETIAIAEKQLQRNDLSPTTRFSLTRHIKRLKRELIEYRQLRYGLSNQKIENILQSIDN